MTPEQLDALCAAALRRLHHSIATRAGMARARIAAGFAAARANLEKPQ